ncbi:MAG: SHOCT domain-containing protein [Clostridium sp.]|uniref:SHOCT domain-containing protein n=1 Tax=Clostridium sp. TaxID=1506 RepID=UPI003D6C8362
MAENNARSGCIGCLISGAILFVLIATEDYPAFTVGLVLLGIICAVAINKGKTEEREENKKRERLERQRTVNQMQKYETCNNIPHNTPTVKITKIHWSKESSNTYYYHLWKNNNELVFHKTYRMSPKSNRSRIILPLQDIISFTREGDVYTETNTSGGRGGGSSVGGAVVGAIVAGGAGAIIGSRKETGSIKTETKRIDNRKTILQFKYENENETCYMFLTSEGYDILLKLIPQKEIKFASKEIGQPVNDDVYAQIKKLAELKEQGILTLEEFDEKKKVLLDKIN